MHLESLLVTGGLQRPEAELLESASGNHYHRARLASVDLDAGVERVVLDYETPAGARPEATPGIRYTAMTLAGDRLYLCTGTEVFIHAYPGLELLGYATHPHFQDIHHVAPVNGQLAVASTGLETVIFLDSESLEPVRYVNAATEPTWDRFDREADWRLVHSTQPHETHPNFIFEMGGAAWVTRGYANDVMCLDDPALTIPLGEARVHDGVRHGDHLFFTGVDGVVHVLDPSLERVVESIDLKVMEESDLPVGWCRGLCMQGSVAYVGYTTLRTTLWKDNVEVFVNSRTGEYKRVLPSRVCAYDLEQGRKLGEYVFPRQSIGAVFGLAVDGAGAGLERSARAGEDR